MIKNLKLISGVWINLLMSFRLNFLVRELAADPELLTLMTSKSIRFQPISLLDNCNGIIYIAMIRSISRLFIHTMFRKPIRNLFTDTAHLYRFDINGANTHSRSVTRGIGKLITIGGAKLITIGRGNVT